MQLRGVFPSFVAFSFVIIHGSSLLLGSKGLKLQRERSCFTVLQGQEDWGEIFPKGGGALAQWLMGYQSVGRDRVLAPSRNVLLLLVLSPN